MAKEKRYLLASVSSKKTGFFSGWEDPNGEPEIFISEDFEEVQKLANNLNDLSKGRERKHVATPFVLTIDPDLIENT